MWRKFKKVDARGTILPVCHLSGSEIKVSEGEDVTIRMTSCENVADMVSVLPSGQIVDDFEVPGCDPYFIVTLEDGLQEFDVITDGEKYSWIYNKTEGRHCHYLGNECVLVKGCDGARILTTRDARIIKALIKAHLESVNVA